jgi:HSP20 family protein
MKTMTNKKRRKAMLPRSIFNLPGFGPRGPFDELERMRRRVDALSDVFSRGLPGERGLSAGVFPLINLTENPDNFYVRAELPGMKAEDLDIQVVQRNLTITGERKILSEGENVRYHRREREAGKFSRVIVLPGDIDAERVDAKMVDGLLTVTLPKPEAAKPRQIAIK